LIIASEIGAWCLLTSTRSVFYKTILSVGYIAVLVCLVFARRVRFAAPAGLGIVCGLPVAAIYLVADALHRSRPSVRCGAHVALQSASDLDRVAGRLVEAVAHLVPALGTHPT